MMVSGGLACGKNEAQFTSKKNLHQSFCGERDDAEDDQKNKGLPTGEEWLNTG